MVKTLLEQLQTNGYLPSQAMMPRHRLSLHEQRTTYVLELQPEMSCCVYLIDGNIINSTEQDKCDYVVLACHDDSWTEVFVELKGSDISHAIKQLRATITYGVFKQTLHNLRRVRVVTPNRIPSNTGNSVVERAKVDFRKMGCDFRPIKSLQPDVLKKQEF